MGGPVARSGKGKLGDDCDEDGPAQTPTVLSYEMFVFCFVIALFGFAFYVTRNINRGSQSLSFTA